MSSFRKKISFRHQAFTLIELLVVISIIALLLSILVPGLGKVRDLGRRIYCGNTLKSIGQANMAYATAWNGFYVPFANPVKNSYGTIISRKWCENEAMLKILFVDSYKEGGERGNFNWPKSFICPSDRNTLAGDGALGVVLMSYGCNYYGIGANVSWTSTMPYMVGCKIDQVKQPGDKLMYTEGVGDWWISMWGANYILGWDRLGYATNYEYRLKSVYGGVAYRHAEGANILFFDGHVEYRKKQRIFDFSDTAMWRAVPYARTEPPADENYED